MSDLLYDDVSACGCCGQDRPYPTKAGHWKFKILPRHEWTFVTVAEVDGHLEMTMDGDTDPSWWPSNAQWEKVICKAFKSRMTEEMDP